MLSFLQEKLEFDREKLREGQEHKNRKRKKDERIR